MQAHAHRPRLKIALADDEHRVNLRFVGIGNFCLHRLGTQTDVSSNLIRAVFKEVEKEITIHWLER